MRTGCCRAATKRELSDCRRSARCTSRPVTCSACSPQAVVAGAYLSTRRTKTGAAPGARVGIRDADAVVQYCPEKPGQLWTHLDMTSNLRKIRESEGLTRAALARMAELSDRTLQRVEGGEPASAVTIGKIVKALNRLPTRLRTYTNSDVEPAPARARKGTRAR